MKTVALLALLLVQAGTVKEPPVAQPEYMRYRRIVSVPARAGQACALLDAQVFPHAAPALSDLRLFALQPGGQPARDAHAIPYVITLSQTVTQETQPVPLLNLGSRAPLGRAGAQHITFDLAMPQRPYSDVVLNLAGHNFIATATVSGEARPGEPPSRRTSLGIFTLFDLTAQHLSRDTTLPLAESTFPFLHVELEVAHAPGAAPAPPASAPSLVTGAEVPPSRAAQTLYTPVAETRSITISGRESQAAFEIPPRVPVERVTFELAPGFTGNFSRDVRITAVPEAPPASPAPTPNAAGAISSGDDLRRSGPMPEETVTGTILRVHATQAGREIRTIQLAIPAILGANLQGPARIDVILENGDDRPLPIAAVRLEMRQRRLCFDSGSALGSALALFYGDPALQAPLYDYPRLFRPDTTALLATLGPERPNPEYHPRPVPTMSFTERYPQVLWIALIAVVCVLGAVAIRASKNVGG